MEEAKHHFRGTKIQITSTGERHLGVVIGSSEFRKEYCDKIVKKWIDEISVLSEFAVTEPQSAYTCYTSGYQHRFTYFLRTIPGIAELLQPLEEVIRHQFLPSILGVHIVSDLECELSSLPPKLGGLEYKDHP